MSKYLLQKEGKKVFCYKLQKEQAIWKNSIWMVLIYMEENDQSFQLHTNCNPIRPVVIYIYVCSQPARLALIE